MSKLGTLLRATRSIDHRITGRQFAKKLGISASFLSHIENGIRFPSDDLLKQMAGYLGLDYQAIRPLLPRVEDDIGKWIEENPEVQILLREIMNKWWPDRLLSFLRSPEAREGMERYARREIYEKNLTHLEIEQGTPIERRLYE